MPVLAALLLLCAAAYAGDTTYSRTEAVPKSSSSYSSSSSSSPHSSPDAGPASRHDRESDEDVARVRVEAFHPSGERHRGFVGRCLDVSPEVASLQEALGLLIFWPFWVGTCTAAGGIWASHIHLFAGRGEMADWQEGRWRFGWGIGVGAASMPGFAGGLPLELSAEATVAVSEAWQLRLRSGAFANLMSPSVDYRRDVFADGMRIGSQLDIMTGYIQAGFPAMADLILPLGTGGFYLGGGAGAVLVKESIEYVRRNDFARGAEAAREEDRWQVLPALDAALGRYGGGGRRAFWRFEIRYQALVHSPLRVSSFPGDNAYVTQAVTWQWAWF